MGMLPVRTERLTIRAFTPADAATFAEYRNDPEVARYQDWDLPVSRAAAEAFVASQAAVTGPVPGDWVQLAIEFEGELAGDVAVGLDGSGALAMIGYTVRRDRQRQGIGREAVTALVATLLAMPQIHRIAATTDPRNHVSAMLLEGLGFRYEGCGRSAAAVRGGWEDDDRYALLRSDREDWLARPRGRPADVRLVEITHANARAVGGLATHHHQERFVATVVDSFRDALFTKATPWMRAVEADGELAGFVMLALPGPSRAEPYLWRLLVDRRHQGRGIGATIVALLTDQLRAEGHGALKVSWVEGPGGPAPFYRRLGFEPTGRVEHGEVEAVLDLGAQRKLDVTDD